jgi:hypothetical protein
MLVLSPPNPAAAVILFAGGHGGLQLGADGAIYWGKGNFRCDRVSCSPSKVSWSLSWIRSLPGSSDE